MDQSYMTARTKFKPSKPLVDMLTAGVINGSLLDYGCGKGNDFKYLQTKKPNTLISGFDPHYYPDLSAKARYDTIFCNYVINYIKDPNEITNLLKTIRKHLVPGGRLIITARSLAEVKGNVKRNDNWIYIPELNGYESKAGVFQRGYDNNTLTDMVAAAKFKIITDKFDIGPVPYVYTIAVKN